MIHHVCNRSISDFVIFNNEYEFSRILLSIFYYQFEKQVVNLARFLRPNGSKEYLYNIDDPLPAGKEKLVNIVAYCIMPTHIHLVIEELKNGGMSLYIKNVLISYSRYFNIKHNRKGPLWEGRSKRILVKSDNQLLHLTRYVHLNPVTAYIVNNPEDWEWSSYKEYTLDLDSNKQKCKYDHLLNINANAYKKYTADGIGHHRELAHIKKLILE